MRSTFLTLHWIDMVMILDVLYFLTVLYSKYFITLCSGCDQSFSVHCPGSSLNGGLWPALCWGAVSPIIAGSSLISPISLDSRLKQIFKCLSTQSHSYTNPSCPWSSHLDCSCSHQVDPGVCSLSLLLFRAWKRGLWVTSPRQLFSTRFGFIHRSQTAAWRVAMLAAPWGRCADHLIFNLSC